MTEDNTNSFSIDKKDENLTQESNDNTNISIKKSTYNKLIKGIIASIVIATFFGGYSLGTMTDSGISSEELKELILQADNNLAKNQQPTQPSAPTKISVSLDDDPIIGNPDAPITIVEFSDFQCPFCKRFVDQTLPSIQEEYIDTGKVNLVYRDFPLDSIHPNAKAAHIASECADEQGEFWQYHDILFEKQAQWSKQTAEAAGDSFKEFASDADLNLASFTSCLDSRSFADEVNKDLQQGISYGITGTPSFYIGNEKDGFVKLSGAQPFQVFKDSIDKQLADIG